MDTEEVNVEIYKQRNRSKTARETRDDKGRTTSPYQRHRLRWRARTPNHAKVANGGAAYINLGDLLDTLDVLWPGPSGEHVTVTFNGATVPLAQSRTFVN